MEEMTVRVLAQAGGGYEEGDMPGPAFCLCLTACLYAVDSIHGGAVAPRVLVCC